MKTVVLMYMYLHSCLLVYLFHIDIVVLYTTCTAAVLVSGEPLRLLLHSQMVR